MEEFISIRLCLNLHLIKTMGMTGFYYVIHALISFLIKKNIYLAYGSAGWEVQEHGPGIWLEPSCCIILWQKADTPVSYMP